MAEHIWSVLCHKGVQDKDTNQISLLEVIEKLVLNADVVEDAVQNPPEGAKRLLVPLQMQLVSWWRRSEQGRAEEATRARLAIIDVDGEEFGGNEFPLPMDKHEKYRTIVKIPAVPIDRGSGTMWFTVSRQDGEGWEALASLPLEVEISSPAPPAET